MKRLNSIFAYGFLLLGFCCQTTYAVWPPSTALEEESKSQEPVASEKMSSVHMRLDTVTSKLEQDERRLVEVIDSLDRDGNKAAAVKPIKEEKNGHPSHQ